MNNHTIECPWDVGERSAERYVRSIIIEFNVKLPVKFKVVMPTKIITIEIKS